MANRVGLGPPLARARNGEGESPRDLQSGWRGVRGQSGEEILSLRWATAGRVILTTVLLLLVARCSCGVAVAVLLGADRRMNPPTRFAISRFANYAAGSKTKALFGLLGCLLGCLASCLLASRARLASSGGLGTRGFPLGRFLRTFLCCFLHSHIAS
jgi:hypothetical protein